MARGEKRKKRTNMGKGKEDGGRWVAAVGRWMENIRAKPVVKNGVLNVILQP